MRITIPSLLAILLSGPSLAQAQPAAEQGTAPPCADQPCPNTRTGDDPATVELRDEERREKALLRGADDRKRWKAIRLYSDTKEPEDLKLSVVKGAAFDMELLPATGLVRFTAPGKAATFRIAAAPDGKRDICPRYNLKVLDASAEHAVMRMSCPRYEYRPNRFHMSVEYFLFDWATRTMRSLWFAASSSKDAPLPEADPPIAVTRLAEGYHFNWSGTFPTDSRSERLSISNSYTREKSSAGLVLVCTDLKASKDEGRENEMCEGRALAPVGAR